MRAIAIIVCLTVVCGCGLRDGEGRSAQTLPDACQTALQTVESQKFASIEPVSGGLPAQATSWVLYEDLNALALASQIIVRGQVTEDCSPVGNDGVRSGPDDRKRMLVSISTVYFGHPRESLLVPATSDRDSSSSKLTFSIGDDVILFLDENESLIGGPQGHWRVANGRAVPNAAHLQSLPLDAFAQALEASLPQD